MITRERFELHVKICERAESLGFKGKRNTLLMDIESADLAFNLRLEDWLNADEYNFMHDVMGITNNIDRSTYPATNFNFFLPRFAGKEE